MFNFALSARQIFFFSYINKKLLKHIIFFQNLGLISSFNYKKKKTINYFHTLNNTFIFKKIKLISTYKHNYYISYNSLKVLKTYCGNSFYILATSEGLLTHQCALKKKIGGKVLYLIY